MSAPLEFTGERFTPECVREIWYEHMHRYAFAVPMSQGRRVLDAACGEGYGSRLLAASAAAVTGVDIDAQAIAHARGRYGNTSSLKFEVGDATALDAFPDASFDLIVSFETLEHVHEQQRMLAGFQRLLAAGGALLISSPDKANYTDATGVSNPFHVRELYRAEFESLLADFFPVHRLYAQKLLFQGALWRIDADSRSVPGEFAAATLEAGDTEVVHGMPYPPLYYVAVCAMDEASLETLPQPALHLFGDRSESVYAHYNAEIAHIIRAGHLLEERARRIAELELQCESLERQLEQNRAGRPGT